VEANMTLIRVKTVGLNALFLLMFALGVVTFGLQGQEKKPPEKLVFETKMGNVTFEHAKHGERVKGDCTVCHENLFPQAKAPLNYKEKMHQVAEASKTSCASCHHAGGMAFASKGNCAKCHVK
jgi:c(7)-type cytochrome triheme protein